MKKTATLFLAGVMALLLASCAGTLKPLDSKQVTVDPQPLVLRGGQVPATITVRFPAKWFNKNATVRITPVLKYATGEKWGTAYTFQGESVRGNAQTVAFKTPSTHVLNSDFPWDPAMRNSELVLMFNATIKGKTVNLPDLKIGEGVIATESLADARFVTPAIAPDKFQRIIKENYDANIHFLIQQANLRSGELNSADVREWKNIVESAHITPNQKVDVEVQAYASPDGGLELNEKLAERREQNTSDYLRRELKRMDVDAPVAAHYTAQDWEGFKALVEQSNLQDKDLVLRVLAMYPDPEVREREIKNISSVFSQLADEILPQLRRSRLVANIQIIGKSDKEISDLAATRPAQLSIDEILYAATLTGDRGTQEKIYSTTTSLFPKDYRAFNNLGVLAYQNENYGLAAQYFDKAQAVASAAGVTAEEVQMNQGLLKLQSGDLSRGKTLIGQVSNVPEVNEALGLIYMQEGRYAEAARELYNTPTNNGILAQILNQDYNRAMQLLEQVARPDAQTHYLRALIGARTAQTNLVSEGLTAAVQADPSLAHRLKDDRDFAKYRTMPFFSTLVR